MTHRFALIVVAPSLALVLTLALLAFASVAPRAAQADSAPNVPQTPPLEDGPSMMERGAKLFFKGLVEEMEPALRDLEALTKDAGPAMRSFLKEMGPAMAELFADIKDFSAYHPPEVQPNGDILIRRKSYDDKGETDGGSPNEDRPHSDPMPAPEGDNPVQKDGKIDI